ncbi:pilus assembly protein TadG-related protein [Streptomyces sp. NBRC 110035]|uniref:pilus assembly protein TadG-related protein n=1 Tax=Streptomyces sp. NBRC 110035 TaxID=1547867 RepID=UPI0005A66F1C|nr:pilus assembly protein TadG-related protein [Streptomyces sp. NBRC 110035]
MRRSRRFGDAGQAFPIYLTVVGGLLFLAFAYLAVGQAAANRNGAQTAADAAALAAAQDRRDQLTGAWVEEILDPTKWQAIFGGSAEGLDDSCWRAQELAAQNDAAVRGCVPNGLLGYTVEVETTDTVGDSIVPGTENMKSQETATAVIDPRCAFDPLTEDASEDTLPLLTCKGGTEWELDPEDPVELLPQPEDLFDVHLAD